MLTTTANTNQQFYRALERVRLAADTPCPECGTGHQHMYECNTGLQAALRALTAAVAALSLPITSRNPCGEIVGPAHTVPTPAGPQVGDRIRIPPHADIGVRWHDRHATIVKHDSDWLVIQFDAGTPSDNLVCTLGPKYAEVVSRTAGSPTGWRWMEVGETVDASRDHYCEEGATGDLTVGSSDDNYILRDTPYTTGTDGAGYVRKVGA